MIRLLCRHGLDHRHRMQFRSLLQISCQQDRLVQMIIVSFQARRHLLTTQMLLIFRLGRPDVLPVTDYGVRKGYALTFQRLPKSRPMEAADLPKPEVLLKRGKRWAPFRSVASWYLWRACDLAKGAAPSGRSSLK